MKNYRYKIIITCVLFLITTIILHYYIYGHQNRNSTLLSADQTLVCPHPNSINAALQLYFCYVITPTPTPTPIPTATPVPTATPAPTVKPADSPPPAVPAVQTGTTTATAAGPVTGCTQQDIQKLVDSVSQTRIQTDLEYLTSNPAVKGSRHISQPGNPAAVQYMKSQFDAAGIQNYFQDVTVDSNKVQNVVGKIPGKTANEYYVVGGHIDSISGSLTTAPGADDDGSGAVATMETARILKTFSQCLNKSLEIGIWNGEEEGMYGSQQYISALQGKVIKGYFHSDRVGYASGGSECVNYGSKAGLGDALANKMIEVNTKYKIGLPGAAQTISKTNSDHASFWDAGIPAFWGEECVETPNRHQETDTMAGVSIDQITKVTKMLVAAVAEIAMQ